jgi:hypothetical protein
LVPPRKIEKLSKVTASPTFSRPSEGWQIRCSEIINPTLPILSYCILAYLILSGAPPYQKFSN